MIQKLKNYESRMKVKKTCFDMLVPDSRGAVLIWLIMVIVIVAGLGAALTDFTATSTYGELTFYLQKKAYYLAESGARYAIPLVSADVAAGTTTTAKIDELNNHKYTLDNNGKFLLEIEDNRPADILIHATGIVNDGTTSESRVKLTYHLNIVTDSPFQDAIYGFGNIKIKKDSVVDSYDSSQGAYGGANVNNNGDVSTATGNIKVKDDSVINGDQNINVGSDVTPEDFPAVEAEDTFLVPSDFKLKDETFTFTDGTFRAETIKLKKDVILNISGDVVLIAEDNFEVKHNSHIVLLPGATLTIYFGKNFKVEHDCTINDGGKPENVVIYGTSGAKKVAITHDSKVYAAIHTPDAKIKIKKDSELFGAVIGSKVKVRNGSKIHFDEALTTGGGGIGGTPRVDDDDIIQYYAPS